MQPADVRSVIAVGRKLETEFRIDLHSPTTGGVWHFLVYGSRESAANLAALNYARELDAEDPSWRTLSILSGPGSADMMRFELGEDDEDDLPCICGNCASCDEV